MPFLVSSVGEPPKAGHPLEGSCQEGKHPPYTPFCIFFAEVCRMAPRCRFAVSPAPVSSIVGMSLAPWRRPRHPSGSRRMMDTRHMARHPAPGTPCAPENSRYSLPCPIVTSTVPMALSDGATPMLARDRGVAKLNKSFGGQLSGVETGSNQLGWLCTIPPSSLTSQPPPLHTSYPKALAALKGI